MNSIQGHNPPHDSKAAPSVLFDVPLGQEKEPALPLQSISVPMSSLPSLRGGYDTAREAVFGIPELRDEVLKHVSDHDLFTGVQHINKWWRELAQTNQDFRRRLWIDPPIFGLGPHPRRPEHPASLFKQRTWSTLPYGWRPIEDPPALELNPSLLWSFPKFFRDGHARLGRREMIKLGNYFKHQRPRRPQALRSPEGTWRNQLVSRPGPTIHAVFAPPDRPRVPENYAAFECGIRKCEYDGRVPPTTQLTMGELWDFVVAHLVNSHVAGVQLFWWTGTDRCLKSWNEGIPEGLWVDPAANLVVLATALRMNQWRGGMGQRSLEMRERFMWEPFPLPLTCIRGGHYFGNFKKSLDTIEWWEKLPRPGSIEHDGQMLLEPTGHIGREEAKQPHDMKPEEEGRPKLARAEAVKVEEKHGRKIAEAYGVKRDVADGVKVEGPDRLKVEEANGLKVEETNWLKNEQLDRVKAGEQDMVKLEEPDKVKVDHSTGPHVREANNGQIDCQHDKQHADEEQ